MKIEFYGLTGQIPNKTFFGSVEYIDGKLKAYPEANEKVLFKNLLSEPIVIGDQAYHPRKQPEHWIKNAHLFYRGYMLWTPAPEISKPVKEATADVKTHTRRTKTGKVVQVQQHTRQVDDAEKQTTATTLESGKINLTEKELKERQKHIDVLSAAAEDWISKNTDGTPDRRELAKLSRYLGKEYKDNVNAITDQFEDYTKYENRPAVHIKAGKDGPDIYLLGWRETKTAIEGTEIHDHGPTEAGVYVYKGTVVERIFGVRKSEWAKGGNVRFKAIDRDLTEGGAIAVSAPYIHEVYSKVDDKIGITIHSYYPPLKKMNFYRVGKAGLVKSGNWTEGLLEVTIKSHPRTTKSGGVTMVRQHERSVDPTGAQEFPEMAVSYKDENNYTVTIVPYGSPGQYDRRGNIYITSPTGRTVKAGYWMDFPEPGWKWLGSRQEIVNDPKSDGVDLWKDWSIHRDLGTENLSFWREKIPLAKRLAMEAKQQATAYKSLKDQYKNRRKNLKEAKQVDVRSHTRRSKETGKISTVKAHKRGIHERMAIEDIKAVRGPIWYGDPILIPKDYRLGKQAAGALGENITVEFLKAEGHKDAHLIAAGKNYPFDIQYNHTLVEVKVGAISNKRDAQKWRLTKGEPGKKEKAFLKKASPQAKRLHNLKKEKAIIKRKERVIREVSKRLGRPVKVKTITMILDNRKKMVDLFRFDGIHKEIRWYHPAAKKGYTKTLKYERS